MTATAWRGAPSIGKDNSTILEDLGLSAGEIDELPALGVISAPPSPAG